MFEPKSNDNIHHKFIIATNMASEIPIPSTPDSSANNMNLSTHYSTFSQMSTAVEHHSTSSGFRAASQPKLYFTPEDWPFGYPFATKTARRGNFYCSPKSPCRHKRSVCSWKLVYKWDFRESAYIFLPDQCKNGHDHPLGVPLLTLDGKQQIDVQTDLTQTEIEFIKLSTLSSMAIPMIQTTMEEHFPGRSFGYELIRRIGDKALDTKFGKDRAQLRDLFVKGELIKKHGGVFIVDPSPDFSNFSAFFNPNPFGSLLRGTSLNFSAFPNPFRGSLI